MQGIQKKIGSDYMELSFGPQWTYISCVRSFVTNFFAIGLNDKVQAEKISLAISELLENAVKYSSGSDAYVRAEISEEGSRVVVVVENIAKGEHIPILKEEIRKVCAGTPEEAYMSKLQEAATRTDGKSQIGLARVRFETGAEITLEIDGNQVKVHAVFQLNGGSSDE